MNLIEAFDERFVDWLGEADWSPWRVFLKALAANPLDPAERPLFRQCTGRSEEFDAPVSEAWCVVGRRGRKSAIGAVLAVHSAVNIDWTSCIAPGETARVLVVAVSKNQAAIIRRYAESILRSRPEYEGLIESVDQEQIHLRGGLAIQCVANSFRSIRGPSVVCAIFDEVAFWRSEESAVPDKEVLRAVRPSMLTTKSHGALLIGLSSPYARKGLLWERFRDHHGEDDSRILVWRADTRTMNPDVDLEAIEEAYADDPVAARSEFGAEFRQDLESFLDPELLASLTRSSPLELPPRTGVKYFGFVDPSGGRGDSFALGISHREEEGRIVVDLIRAVQPPFGPAAVVEDFAALLKEYHLSETTGDQYSAEWCTAAFREQGITYRTSKLAKSAIYLNALPIFTQERVELPDHRRLLVELASLERRTARGGRDSVDHPPRCHDDLSNVAAGSIVLAETSTEQSVAGRPVSIRKTEYTPHYDRVD